MLCLRKIVRHTASIRQAYPIGVAYVRRLFDVCRFTFAKSLGWNGLGLGWGLGALRLVGVRWGLFGLGNVGLVWAVCFGLSWFG